MDKSESTRALELRNRVLEMGLPCAVSFPPFAVDHLRPVICILTFQDAIDTIRRSPLDDVPAMVLGSGFVNSLLHAKLFSDPETMLAQMESYVFACLKIQKQIFFGFPGYLLPGGFVINSLQIFYRVFSLHLTEREKRILQLILFAPEHMHSYRRIEAYCFPYPYCENTYDVSNTITVQISMINRKAVEHAERKIIRYCSHGPHGGYILDVRKPEKKK